MRYLIFILTLIIIAHAGDSLTERESYIIAEMNLVRSNPGAYAEKYIAPLLKRFDGDTLTYLKGTRVITKEGISAVLECIAYLRAQPSVNPLEPSKGLSSGADDHVKDQAISGMVSHSGSDGSRAKDRVDRYGKWHKVISENINYGLSDPREIIITMLIDDGVKSRGHRNTILSPRYSKTGVACGYHPKYKVSCVITYAGQYIEKVR